MKLQIAKEVFLSNLDTMKELLMLAEFKMGKETDDYEETNNEQLL
jgi:hypothetical protein